MPKIPACAGGLPISWSSAACADDRACYEVTHRGGADAVARYTNRRALNFTTEREDSNIGSSNCRGNGAGIGLAVEDRGTGIVARPGERCHRHAIHWPFRSASAARFSGRASVSVSNRPICEAEAACASTAWPPTT